MQHPHLSANQYAGIIFLEVIQMNYRLFNSTQITIKFIMPPKVHHTHLRHLRASINVCL